MHFVTYKMKLIHVYLWLKPENPKPLMEYHYGFVLLPCKYSPLYINQIWSTVPGKFRYNHQNIGIEIDLISFYIFCVRP